MTIILVTDRDHITDGIPQEPDDLLLLAALARRGVRARVDAWDDVAVDWSVPALVVVRSCWDYHHRREEFVRWATAVARLTTLHNPLPTIAWNTHKSYLQDLARQGIPVVPTEWIAAGTSLDLAALFARRGWARAIIKPAVGGHELLWDASGHSP